MKNKMIKIFKGIFDFLISPLKEKYPLKSTFTLMLLMGVTLVVAFEVVNYQARGIEALLVIVGLTLLTMIIGFYILALLVNVIKDIPSTVWFFTGAVLTGLYFLFESSRSEVGSYIAMAIIGYFMFYVSYHLVCLYKIIKNKRFFILSRTYKAIIHFCGLLSILGIYYIFFTGGLSGKVYENAFDTFERDVVVHESLALYDVKEGVYGNEDYMNKYHELSGEESLTTNIAYFITSFGESKKDYLGFNIRNVPLNAHYYMPDGEGPYPVALIVHGNHEMVDSSEVGYDYLGKYLAERGYIVISVDENFLNYSIYDSQIKKDKLSGENDARAYILLEHIRFLEEAQSAKDSIFYGKVDLDSIALMGHSRGGEAVAIAEFFNHSSRLPANYYKQLAREYSIKSIVALAPTDGQYKPGQRYNEISDVNYLLLHGTHDMDVTYVAGSNQYERINFTKGDYIKSQVLIYGANHGHFNSSWGIGDSGPLSDFLHNTGQLISRKQQEETASQLIYYFLEGTLKEKDDYKAAFKNIKNFVDIPDNLYFTQYHSSNDLTVVDYSEDNYLETTTIEGGYITGSGFLRWSEGTANLDGRDSQVYGVYLTTNKSKVGKYKLSFDEPLNLIEYQSLYLTLSDETIDSKESYNFDVELTDITGMTTRISLSNYGLLQHKLDIELSKFEFFDDASRNESMFQTFELHLNDFDESHFDWASVSRITLLFPEGEERKVFIKEIGIR